MFRPFLGALVTGIACVSVCHGQARFSTPVVPGKQAAALVEKAYAVADLVVPIRMDLEADKTDQQTLEGQLMETLRASVAPDSWRGQGGAGTMHYFSQGMSLVIRQTPQVHDRIGALLADLRRPQDVEVAIEVRFLYLADGAAMEQPPAGDKETRFLTDLQVYQLLEAAQADRKTSIVQVPKLTVANGQRARMQSTHSQYFLTGVNPTKVNDRVIFAPNNEAIETGVKYTVRPLVSADQRFVELSFCLSLTSIDDPVPLIPVQVPVEGPQPTPAYQMFLQQPRVATTKLDRLLRVPDGATALLDAGMVAVEARNEFTVPVLSRVPYVGRLFRNVGYLRDTQRLLVLVTPRVIVHEANQAPTTSRSAPGQGPDQEIFCFWLGAYR